MTFKNTEELESFLLKENYSKKQQDLYVYAFNRNVDIYPYLSKKIPRRCLDVILKGLRMGVDVSLYDDYEKFTSHQMEEIFEGLINGLDVSIYAKPEFIPRQMQILKSGLLKGLDVSVYANPRLTVEKMEILESGLLKGLDVSIYADPRLTAEQMLQFHNRMLRAEKKEIQQYKGSNGGRFNLEEFRLQRVDFEGYIHNCNIVSRHKFSLLVKPLFWQGEYICDHIWIDSDARGKNEVTKNPHGFNFGDYISFSAKVEPYIHNWDNMLHYGLYKMKNAEVIIPTEEKKNFEINSTFCIPFKDFKIFDNESKELTDGKELFISEYSLSDSVINVELKLYAYMKDALVFKLYVDSLTYIALYNPYNNPNHIRMGKYYLPVTGKGRLKRKLINTFFQAKHLRMFPLISHEEFWKEREQSSEILKSQENN